MESSMTKADFSGKGLGAPGAIVVASFMAKWWALALISSQLSPDFDIYPLWLSTLLFPLTTAGC